MITGNKECRGHNSNYVREHVCIVPATYHMAQDVTINDWTNDYSR